MWLTLLLSSAHATGQLAVPPGTARAPEPTPIVRQVRPTLLNPQPVLQADAPSNGAGLKGPRTLRLSELYASGRFPKRVCVTERMIGPHLAIESCSNVWAVPAPIAPPAPPWWAFWR